MVPGYNDHAHTRDCHWKSGMWGRGRGEWVDWVKSQRFFERIFEAKCAFPVGWGGIGWA